MKEVPFDLPYTNTVARFEHLEQKPAAHRGQMMDTMERYMVDQQRLSPASIMGLTDLAHAQIALGRHTLVEAKSSFFGKLISNGSAYKSEVASVTEGNPLPTGEGARSEARDSLFRPRPKFATAREKRDYDEVGGFFEAIVEPELRMAEEILLQERLQEAGIKDTLSADEVNGIVHIKLGQDLLELGAKLDEQVRLLEDNLVRHSFKLASKKES